MDILPPKNSTPRNPMKHPEIHPIRRSASTISPTISPTKKSPKKLSFTNIFLVIFLLLFFCSLVYGSFFIYKTYRIGKKINPTTDQNGSFLETIKSVVQPNLPPIKKGANGQTNILLLGMAGQGKPGQNLTDTLMIASVDTKTHRVSLLSIPRDLYVTIPDTKTQTKINSVYQYGLSNFQNDQGKAANAIEKTIANITGLPIDYYIIMNFDGFERAIDNIDGINIMSERDLYDERYPGPNYSYETFSLSKGFHHLDGATALKYARERHNDPEGDFGRAKRQQQIMQAVKNKIFSTSTLMNVFALNNLFDTLGDNIKTNIAIDEFPSFFELAKKLDTNNINNVVVDAWNTDSLLKVSHVQYGDIRAFVLVPRIGNYSEIHDLAANIFDLNALKRRKEEIAKENATLVVLNQSGDAQILTKIKKVLQDNLNYKNVKVLPNPTKTITEKSVVYDATNGQKPFTLDELAAKLPAEISYTINEEATSLLQKENYDMTILIGKDLITKYNMEDDTLENLNAAQDDQMYINLLDK
ncbi:MAG: LCP family protein [Parcubacteria group bacterium]|jgi:LCP family protein required for cell wall assembly